MPGFRMEKSAYEICRVCGSEAETAEHMVCKYSELASKEKFIYESWSRTTER